MIKVTKARSVLVMKQLLQQDCEERRIWFLFFFWNMKIFKNVKRGSNSTTEEACTVDQCILSSVHRSACKNLFHVI